MVCALFDLKGVDGLSLCVAEFEGMLVAAGVEEIFMHFSDSSDEKFVVTVATVSTTAVFLSDIDQLGAWVEGVVETETVAPTEQSDLCGSEE